MSIENVPRDGSLIMLLPCVQEFNSREYLIAYRNTPNTAWIARGRHDNYWFVLDMEPVAWKPLKLVDDIKITQEDADLCTLDGVVSGISTHSVGTVNMTLTQEERDNHAAQWHECVTILKLLKNIEAGKRMEISKLSMQMLEGMIAHCNWGIEVNKSIDLEWRSTLDVLKVVSDQLKLFRALFFTPITETQSKVDFSRLSMISAAASSGNKNAIDLALQITDSKPCDKCGYIWHACRCTKECWLVELFEPHGGNSFGLYHTGFTDIGGFSRSTQDPYAAKRYTSKAEAEYISSELTSMRGVWRAVEHSFADAVNNTFQQNVSNWALECFGTQLTTNLNERNARFIEEAIELVQACGFTKTGVKKMVDYVYARPVGHTPQEVGGVLISLALLCAAHQIDMDKCGEDELARVEVNIDKIREKQKTKPNSIK